MDMTEKNIPTPDAQPKEPCFEDAFMDILSGMISLCLEAVNEDADMVYALAYQDPGERAFNVFYRKDGIIKTTNHLMSDDICKQLLSAGIEDLEKLVEVCGRYDKKCPNELKLIYDVKTGQFDSHFRYEPYGEDDDGFIFVLLNWVNEEKAKAK